MRAVLPLRRQPCSEPVWLGSECCQGRDASLVAGSPHASKCATSPRPQAPALAAARSTCQPLPAQPTREAGPDQAPALPSARAAGESSGCAHRPGTRAGLGRGLSTPACRRSARAAAQPAWRASERPRQARAARRGTAPSGCWRSTRPCSCWTTCCTCRRSTACTCGTPTPGGGRCERPGLGRSWACSCPAC